MDPATRFREFAVGHGRRAAGWTTTVAAQPGWVTRTAVLAFLLVIALPLLALLLVAALVGVAVFAALALAHAVRRRLAGLGPDRSGRRNVRVVAKRPPR